jgi:hypothetical protein
VKLLVAIMTCHKLDYYVNDCTQDWINQQGWRNLDQQARVDAIRATWVRALPEGVDYKFFYGSKLRQNGERRNPPQVTLRKPDVDEVFLDCGDNYTSNPAKMKAICQWALDHGYDMILRCDDDTFIYPDRILVRDLPLWEGKDYSGSTLDGYEFHPGGCMFLSARAMRLVIDAAVTCWADDTWIGQVMRNNQIPLNSAPRIYNPGGKSYNVDPAMDIADYGAFHSCKPEVMTALHQRNLATTL